MTTDLATVVVLNTMLALGLVISVIADIRVHLRSRQGGVNATVVRGEQSMNALYVLYGFSTVAIGLVVDVAEHPQGHKAALILIDYVILTYLFFFNGWFCNRVVFKALGVCGRTERSFQPSPLELSLMSVAPSKRMFRRLPG